MHKLGYGVIACSTYDPTADLDLCRLSMPPGRPNFLFILRDRKSGSGLQSQTKPAKLPFVRVWGAQRVGKRLKAGEWMAPPPHRRSAPAAPVWSSDDRWCIGVAPCARHPCFANQPHALRHKRRRKRAVASQWGLLFRIAGSAFVSVRCHVAEDCLV